MNALNNDTVTAAPIDAATVILLRDGAAGLETLLLCRGKSKTVMNKAWVFPGGKLDSDDFAQEAAVTNLPHPPASMLNEPQLEHRKACALFAAACRETREETGVVLRAEHLIPWSRWITPNEPSMMKKRFDARFFITRLPDGQTATHDGEEATDSAWMSPRDALTAYLRHEMTLAPPQIMTLLALCRHRSTQSCLDEALKTPTYCIEPGVIKGADDTRTLVYPGDAQHPSQKKLMPGPTRLLWNNGHFEPDIGFDAWLLA
jgi:8-oxo-dGTP pyrophosphatase MutT (NUDIX family)